MAKKQILNKDDARKASLQALYDSAGWKIYEEEVILAKLEDVKRRFDELTRVGVSTSDLPRLNELIRQRAFLEEILALGEPLKEEAAETAATA